MNDYDDTQDGQHDDNGSHTELPAVRHDLTAQPALYEDKLNAIAARLDALPVRQQLTLTDAILKLSPAIKKLRDRGYSNDEVAAELTASGVTISGRTLSRLTASAKPAKRRAPRRA